MSENPRREPKQKPVRGPDYGGRSLSHGGTTIFMMVAGWIVGMVLLALLFLLWLRFS